jgi:hypothetical protein
MRFHLYANVAFEDWDWRNSINLGIGGCETSQTEMARGLARRGHEVYSYAPIPADCPREWEGTHWRHINEADFNESGIWVLYRCPEMIDKFDRIRTDQVLWLMFQDWYYPTLTSERLNKLDRAMILCHAHEKFLLGRCPELRGKTWITRNGIKPDLIAETEASSPIVRDPHRIMYASSPDRGLLAALKIFRRVKEHIPDASFVATYGFNNIDKMIEKGAKHFQRNKDECLKLMEETGAVFAGRLSQRQLYREWFKTGLTVYCTNFFETGWITGLEAQALGAIPVFSPVYAQGENTKHGAMVVGNPDDPLTIARFVKMVVGLMRHPELQEQIRKPMMCDVRANWGWEQFVWKKPEKNWEEAAERDLQRLPIYPPQLSIITPTIRPQGLPMVWECLKKQTVQKWEWLIGAPASMLDEIRSLLPNDRRIRLFAEPERNPDDFYSLNRTWNMLVHEAQCEPLVFLVDWIWFPDDMLAKLAPYPGGVSGFGHHYKEIVNDKPEELWLKDQRDPTTQNVLAMELACAKLPRSAILEVGGFDEKYDKVAALSEKELCARLHKLGVPMQLNPALEYRNWTHPKEWPNWDERFEAAKIVFNEDLKAIAEGRRLNIKEFQCPQNPSPATNPVEFAGAT